MRHLFFWMSCFLIGASGAVFAEPARPNIIVIMADDLGYGDVGCYGAKPEAVKTPHIDRLAAEGLRFTRGYCSASTCTPTRFSFLTGMYAFRQKGTGIGGINGTALIQPGTTTLPSILKRAGYATAVIGKWHLGLGAGDAPDWNGDLKPGPLEIGFDHCFLLPNTNDRVPSVYVVDHQVQNLEPNDPLTVAMKNPDGQPTGITQRDMLKMDWSHGHNATVHNGISRIGFMAGGKTARWRDEDLADAFVRRSVEWMADQKKQNKPFFLFFASHDIHVPRMPHERFHGATTLGFRGDAIAQLDWSVGALMQAVEKMGVADNTLVIFCSDNGPVLDDGYKDGAVEKIGSHQPSGPLRGGKYSLFEGGTRTPFITHWPGRIKPGESEAIVCTIDLAASFSAMTDQPLASEACPDSFNVLPALLGQDAAKGRTELVQQDNGAGGTLMTRDWKYIAPKSSPGKGRTVGKVQLYHLAQDIAEANNVAEMHADVAQKMSNRLKEIRSSGRHRE